MRAAGPSTLPGALQDRLGVLPGGTRSLGAQSPSLEAIWAGGGDAAVVWDRKGAWGSGGLLLVTGHPARGAGAAACPQVGLPDGEPDAKAGLSSERRLPQGSSVASDIQGGRRPSDLHTSDDSARKEGVAATAHTQARMSPHRGGSSRRPAPGQLHPGVRLGGHRSQALTFFGPPCVPCHHWGGGDCL